MRTVYLVILSLTLSFNSSFAGCLWSGGEGLGYHEGYPWSSVTHSRVTPELTETSRGFEQYSRMVIQRGNKTIDWFAASFEQRSEILRGDLPQVLSEVKCGVIWEDKILDDNNNILAVDKFRSPILSVRNIYCLPTIVGHKFAEENQQCKPVNRNGPRGFDSLNTLAKKNIVDKSCGFYIRKKICYGSNDENTRERLYAPSAKALSSLSSRYIDSPSLHERYLDLLHYGFVLSLENIVAKEGIETLDKRKKKRPLSNTALARKFLRCAPERDISHLYNIIPLKKKLGL